MTSVSTHTYYTNDDNVVTSSHNPPVNHFGPRSLLRYTSFDVLWMKVSMVSFFKIGGFAFIVRLYAGIAEQAIDDNLACNPTFINTHPASSAWH